MNYLKKTTEIYEHIMQRNNIKNYVLINAGISDEISIKNINDNCRENNSLYSTGDASIKITTVDNEVMNKKINVGFIKADLEGYGFKMVKGALNTIKKYRPVISVGVYHGYEELFKIKPFLEALVNNYTFEFQLHRFSKGKFVELTLFCYPNELREESSSN